MDVFARKRSLSCSPLRRRKRAADRWVRRMANKRLEKRIADLRSEVRLMNDVLREDVMTALWQGLKQLEENEASERARHYSRLERELRSRLGRAEGCQTDAPEGGEDDVKPMTPPESDTDGSSANGEPPTDELGERSEVLLNVCCDRVTSDGRNDPDASSHPAAHEQEEDQMMSSDAPAIASTSTSQLTEAESSGNLVHADHSEAGSVQADGAGEASLMERQWEEWLDMQETKRDQGPKNKAATGQEGTPEQEEAASPTSWKKNAKGVGAMWKVKMYFRGLYDPRTLFYRILEDQD